MSIKQKKMTMEEKNLKSINSLLDYTKKLRKEEGKNFKSIDDVTAKSPDVWRKKKGKKTKAKRKTKNCGCK
jgi:hypothetical protein